MHIVDPASYSRGCGPDQRGLDLAFFVLRIQELYTSRGGDQQAAAPEAREEWNEVKAELSQLESRAQLILAHNMAVTSEAVSTGAALAAPITAA